MKSGEIIYGKHKIITLIAETSSEQEKGLMHQPFPPPVMTFVYSYATNVSFWMKNTPSPLDIIFCLNNKIKYITHGKPNSTEIISCPFQTNCVIEMPRGMASDLNMKPGDNIKVIF